MSKIKCFILDFATPIKVLGFLKQTKTAILIGAIISVLTVVFVPQFQVRNIKITEEKRIELENANRITLVQTLGGLFFFITAYFTWRNLQIAEQNLKVTEQNFNLNLKATEDKQITEQFAKAIELLGIESMHVRLGAIYALERIAEDSDKDYWQIMEIFTAYVREQSPYLPKSSTCQTKKDPTAIAVLNQL